MGHGEYGCICQWTDCQQYHKYFLAKDGHHWKGPLIKLNYNPSCLKSTNLWASICKVMPPSAEKIQELQSKYDEVGRKKKQVQFKVARHHFDACFFELKGMRIEPIPLATARSISCHPDRNLATDQAIQYNKAGHTNRWKDKHQGTFIVRAPSVSQNRVQATYNSMKQLDNGDRRSHAIIRIRENQEQQAIIRQQQEESQRTPDEWKAIIAAKDAEIRQKNEENAEMRNKLKELQDSQSSSGSKRKNITQKHRHRAKRARSELNTSNEDEKRIISQLIGKVKVLLAKCGGLSRFTIFNDEWHKQHSDSRCNAANILFGYVSWEETKYYVNAFFPGEVDEKSDPSFTLDRILSDDEPELKRMSPFERCLLCKLFIRMISQQSVLTLLSGTSPSTVKRVLEEWMPKWANVGLDMWCLDITADFLAKELPDLNREKGKANMVFTDGKDGVISSKQSCGSGSIVGSDYWDNVINYTRIEQPTIPSKDVSQSKRRVCTSCKQGGIVLHCSECKKWYHFDCHAHGCCNHNPMNPY